MRKQLIILTAICFLSGNYSLAQLSLKDKITVDYTGSLGIPANINGTSFAQTGLSIWKNQLNLNMKLARKISLELRGGFSKFNTDEYSMRDFNYGLGLNFFFPNSYAPLGNSFGVFYQVHNFMPTDYNEFYGFLSSPKVNYYETTTQINYKVDVVGFQFNFVSMLSNKAPLYFKYGFHFCIPVQSEIYDASFSKTPFQEYSSGRAYGVLNDQDLLRSVRRSTLFALNLGLGFLF